MVNPRNNSNIIKWIDKVIQSCKTHEQLESAKRLVQNYENLYNDYHFFDITLNAQYRYIIFNNGKA